MAEDWVREERAVGSTDAEHLNGVPWYEAPIPSRFHICKPQTRGWYKLRQVERCACGAIRGYGGGWISKNERRKGVP